MSEKLCAYCKINPATNRYTKEGKEGAITEYYCLSCYRKVKSADEKIPSWEEGKGPSQCPNCGWTVQDFKKTSLVGCEYCYKALSWAIQPMIERMQGNAPHCGKEQILTNKQRLLRRHHAVSVILGKKTNQEEIEAYEEELQRLQMLLSQHEEEE